MVHDSAEVIRIRAELARRLAAQLNNERARRELLEIANDLDAEAYKLSKAARTHGE